MSLGQHCVHIRRTRLCVHASGVRVSVCTPLAYASLCARLCPSLSVCLYTDYSIEYRPGTHEYTR